MTKYSILKENKDYVTSVEEKYESMQNQITDLIATVCLGEKSGNSLTYIYLLFKEQKSEFNLNYLYRL